MKKYFLSILLVFIISSMSAQEKIKWYSITEAIEQNQKEPRKFLVDVYTDWCGWCKRMDANTFSVDSLARYVNENFYAVKFDAELKENITIGGQTYKFVATERRGYHELAAILLKGELSYPTIVYLDESLRIIQVDPGYKTSDQLYKIVEFVKEEKYKVPPAI